MINITKKAAIISYLNYFITSISSLIILPFVLSGVTAEEYAIWNVFISIQALVILIDGGLSTLVARYTTYAYCGANSIPVAGVPDVVDGSPNYSLVFKVFFSARSIYRKMAIISVFALAIGGVYVAHLGKGTPSSETVVVAWIIFSFAVAVRIYYTYVSSFMKGTGRIYQMNLISTIDTIVHSVIKLFFLVMGWGILGMAISYAISLIFTRFMLIHGSKDVFNENRASYDEIKYQSRDDTETKKIDEAFRKNMFQVGTVVVSNYLQGQGTTLVCSSLMPLNYTASYSLTMQLMNVIVSLASTPYTTFKPKLNELRITAQKEKFKDLYSVITFLMWIILFLGAIGIAWVLPKFWWMFNSNTELLPTGLTILICLYSIVCANHQRATNLIALGNRQPYVRSYVVSSALMVICEIIVLRLGFGLLGFLIVNLFVQAGYNGWKWPLEVFKTVDVSTYDVSERFFRITKQGIQLKKGEGVNEKC